MIFFTFSGNDSWDYTMLNIYSSVSCRRDNGVVSTQQGRERSGSVVECLTRGRGTAGMSLTGVTVLCP